MNQLNFFQDKAPFQGDEYVACGNTIKKVILKKDTQNFATFSCVSTDLPMLSNTGMILESFDKVIREELEEYDIPYRPEAIASAKFLLIEYFGSNAKASYVANGFTPKLELNALGYVKLVWYTKKKNLSLTFKENEYLLLIDDEDNIIGDSATTNGLQNQFQRVERILKKYA